MNTYSIAPTVTKMVMDSELLAHFNQLATTLRWRTLTSNLDSCESGGFLYFRITLRLDSSGTKYAGFESGAPFMLTRDSKVKKKGFFLRHWVRQETDVDTGSLPASEHAHMQLAVVGDVMLVRVHIDREMSLADTFKSVPFATWMFQVVQVDAAIDGVPGLRFAFAIERTVTPEERVTIQSNVEHTKEQTKKQRAASKLPANRIGPVRPPPPPPPPPSLQPEQPAAGQANPALQSARRAAAAQTARAQQTPSRPLNPAGLGGIVARTLNPAHAVPVAPRATTGRPRAGARARATPAPASGSFGRPLQHPLLKLWEKRPLDDPYEPIFVAGPDATDKRIAQSWRVETGGNPSMQYHHRIIASLPGAAYPDYFLETPAAGVAAEAGTDTVITYPAKRARVAKGTEGEKEGEKEGETTEARHVAAVKRAAEFNATLAAERAALQCWLAEDGREAEEGEAASEEEDSDSSE